VNPFASFLRDLRVRRRLAQEEFATLLGYEQSYVSALEVGIKGPPSSAFLASLIVCLNLDVEEQLELTRTTQASRRRFLLPHHVSTDIFLMCNELWDRIDALHPVQVRMIREIVKIPDLLRQPTQVEPIRIRRRQKKEVDM
jgi:transcriptional regulator with XRE-family HTH domain